MRTDAIIDRRRVRCPNASNVGLDNSTAKVGDLLVFTEGGRERLGRMLGRVAWAPALQETPAIKDFILVVTLFPDLTFTGERWVDPKDVTRVFPITMQAEVLKSFLSDEMLCMPLDEVRHVISEWSTLPAYLVWKAQKDKDLAEYLALPLCSRCQKHRTRNALCVDCRLEERTVHNN